MAHIKRRGGRWQATYRGPDKRERTRTFDRKVDAQEWLDGAGADMGRGTWVDERRGRVTFAEWVETYFAGADHKRATTMARDRTVTRRHLLPVLGDRPLARITSLEVGRLVDRMKATLAASTVRTNYGVLRAIFSAAVDAEVIGRSPCRGVRMPEQARTAKRLAAAADIARLADEMPVDYRVAVFLGALGLRQAEVFGLRVGSINFLRRSLTVQATVNEVDGRIVEGTGKTVSSLRTLSVPQTVLDELSAHLARTGRRSPGELVVQAPDGGPVRAGNFRSRVYNPAVRRAGLEGLTFHRLRHSAGHLMRELGVPLEVIQRRLGHRSIRTTADVYGSLPESVDQAVAGQLDNLFGQRRRLRRGN